MRAIDGSEFRGTLGFRPPAPLLSQSINAPIDETDDVDD